MSSPAIDRKVPPGFAIFDHNGFSFSRFLGLVDGKGECGKDLHAFHYLRQLHRA